MIRIPARTFDEYLSHSESYMTAVREAGDQPWFNDPHRRAKVAAKLGLPHDTDAETLRRALWDRSRK